MAELGRRLVAHLRCQPLDGVTHVATLTHAALRQANFIPGRIALASNTGFLMSFAVTVVATAALVAGLEDASSANLLRRNVSSQEVNLRANSQNVIANASSQVMTTQETIAASAVDDASDAVRLGAELIALGSQIESVPALQSVLKKATGEFEPLPAPPDPSATETFDSIETTLLVEDPRRPGCCVEVPVCLPADCQGSPEVCTWCGLVRRGVVYCWSCGYRVEVTFGLFGRVKVRAC